MRPCLAHARREGRGRDAHKSTWGAFLNLGVRVSKERQRHAADTADAGAGADPCDRQQAAPAAPSVWVAYLLFFSSGVLGTHHIYLRRPHQVGRSPIPPVLSSHAVLASPATALQLCLVKMYMHMHTSATCTRVCAHALAQYVRDSGREGGREGKRERKRGRGRMCQQNTHASDVVDDLQYTGAEFSVERDVWRIRARPRARLCFNTEICQGGLGRR